MHPSPVSALPHSPGSRRPAGEPDRQQPASVDAPFQAFGRALAARLPGRVLRQIFCYLPLSCQAACALVCHHWCANVPDTRKTVARWLRERSLQQRERAPFLLEGFDSRIRPLLARLNSPFLPLLERQYQELKRQQETQQRQPQARTAQSFCAGLIQYALHQQLITTDQLGLQPLPLAAAAGSITAAQFSPCSRWLAVAQKVLSGQTRSCLYLYAWHQGRWQAETLQPVQLAHARIATYVYCLAFSNASPVRLFTGHDDSLVLCWHKPPDSHVWCANLVFEGSEKFSVFRLIPATCTDLFVVCKEYDDYSWSPSWRAHALQQHDSGPRWQRTASKTYDKLYSIAAHQHQVVIATSSLESCTVLDIWQRALNADLPGGWGCQRSVIKGLAYTMQLHYSPDGRHLLGLLANRYAALWEQDDDNRLRLRIHTPCALGTHSSRLHDLFHKDGKQLMLPPSHDRINIWAESSPGCWVIRESSLVAVPFGHDPFHNDISSLKWGADGNTLIRIAENYLDIWHKNEQGIWHQRMLCARGESDASRPQAMLLPCGDNLCATALWEESRLWIHGENQHRCLVKKAGCLLDRPATGLMCSPDGLSLLVEMAEPQWAGPLMPPSVNLRGLNLLQLTGPQRRDTGESSEPSPSTLSAPAEPAPRPGPRARRIQKKRHRAPHDRLPDALPVPKRGRSKTHDTVPCYAQTLPPELLHQIFNELPLSEQGGCALVCHHWRACLPGFRLQLAAWLQQHQGASTQQHNALLSAGYSLRIPRALACQASRLLPVLQRQHQELLRLQTLLGQQLPGCLERLHTGYKERKARHLLAAAIRYSLHQQLIGARQLALRPAPLSPPPAGPLANCAFSPCGRWLAAACLLPGEGDSLLRLYGWRNGGWQQERLHTAAPVTHLRFSVTEPQTLFTGHDNSTQILVWQRDATTNSWDCVYSCRAGVQLLHHIVELAPMGCGDLVVCTRQNRDREQIQQLLFFSPLAASGRWGRPVAWLYAGNTHFTLCRPEDSWLAQALSTPAAQPGQYTNEVHIWKKGLNASSPNDWACQASVLPPQACAIRQLDCSPDGHLLVVLYENRQIALWTLQQDYRVRDLFWLCSRAPLLRQHRALSTLLQFHRDGTQLALAASMHQIQFWKRNESGSWQLDGHLHTPTGAHDTSLESLQLSGNSRTLVRTTACQIDIWHKDADNRWQRRLFHRVEANSPAPLALLAGPGATLCVTATPCMTATGPQGRVRLYAPDSQGELVIKGSMTLETPAMPPLCASEDGLSLLPGSWEGASFWQLDPGVEPGCQHQAGNLPG